MAKVIFTRLEINILRSLLGQEGWAKDFGDFYDAGKALSEWPKDKYIPQNSPLEEFAKLRTETCEFEVSEKAKAVVEKALRHYILGAGSPTDAHFAIVEALGIQR